MADDAVAAEGLSTRNVVVEGDEVRVTSYLVGRRFSARVDNIDPGGIIGRGRGATREEAEALALDDAELRLALSHSRKALGAASRALRGGRDEG